MAPKTKKQSGSVLGTNTSKANISPKSPLASEESIDQVDLTQDGETADGREDEPNTPTGTKRKARHDADQEPVSSDGNVDKDMEIDANCNQVRTKISKFLESGEMTIGEFCKAIGVPDKTLYDFLRFSKATEGSDNQAYRKAWLFFKTRDEAGLKMPTKKQKTTGAKGKPDGRVDLSGIELGGEANDDVRVYDSCDEIRKKIGNYLRRAGVTQASFCRDMIAHLHASKARQSIQGRQLSAFRSKKGADAGNTSIVFYAAYVFFEKLRIKEDKPKSKHREQMEKIWGAQGFNITDNVNARGYLCKADSRPVQDEFGRVSFEKMGGRGMVKGPGLYR